MESKLFSIAGHIVRVNLESPWTFKELSEEQKQLVERLKSGEDVGVESVPADRQEQLAVNDSLMGKEHMTREIWDSMEESEKEAFRHSLDFLQYAPFEVSGGTPLFTMTVKSGPMDTSARENWKKVVSVDQVLPYYYGYEYGDDTVYEFFPSPDVRAGFFVQNADASEGAFYPEAGIGPRLLMMQVNTSLMIQFTFATAGLSTALLHASVTRYKGVANLFFGVSGTGKSTHSRLWHEFVPGSDLMNDDNPVMRITPEGVKVYGGPWSGKTLCYRNVEAPVNALVRLEQAPENRIERLSGLQAYASLVAAVSSIRWNSDIMDKIIPTVEAISMNVPCYKLECRPDAQAVETCKNAIYENRNL